MSFIGGQPPGSHAGDISPQTQALRPPIQLAAKECQAARKLRRRGWEIHEICARLGATEDVVRQALATMRTRNHAATRGTLNATVAARDYVLGEAQDDEACWETLDRLLVELAFRRALAGTAVSSGVKGRAS